MALDEYRNSGRNDAYPGQDKLAQECSTNRETVNRALKKAESLGYIFAKARPRDSTGKAKPVVWGFSLPPSQSDDTGTLEASQSDRTVTMETNPRVTTQSSQSDDTVRPRVTAPSHKPISEPLSEPISNDAASVAALLRKFN